MLVEPIFSWVRMERRQRSRGTWLEGMEVISASTYLQLGEDVEQQSHGTWLEGLEEEGRWQC